MYIHDDDQEKQNRFLKEIISWTSDMGLERGKRTLQKLYTFGFKFGARRFYEAPT